MKNTQKLEKQCMNCRIHTRHRAFSLIELLVVIAIIAILVSLLLPAIKNARRSARQMLCATHLQQFGRAYGSYANDFKDLIGSLCGDVFDPMALEQHTTHPVIARQAKNIINTFDRGRPRPLNNFGNLVGATNAGYSVAEQYEHLVLIGYASSNIQMPLAVCPEDRARLEWSAHPYDPKSWAYQPRNQITKLNAGWLPYSSSYQLVPAAAAYSFFVWQGGKAAYTQADSHDTYNLYKVYFGRRSISEVMFPSAKVAMMDSQQRHFSVDKFYAYPDAKQPLLFWDGAVSIRKTGDANKGWFPSMQPENNVTTTFRYSPDLGFESPVQEGTSTVTGYYRWTRSGLHGIDFGGAEAGNSIAGESRSYYGG